jgi:Ca-activated chloride channel family protein
MSARWKRLGSIAIIGLGMTVTAFGQNKPPAEQDVAAAIARGVTFLKEAQSREGYWNEPAQAQHQLGMTALAGLALLENGIPRESREIGKARELVTALASQSDQTYDIALAILFLARCQEGRRGESDALIQSLGRRLAGGDHEGIWDYNVPRNDEESTTVPGNPRRGARRKGGRIGRVFGTDGDNSNTQFALLGLWASGRHGFDSDAALESIDGHFRSSQNRDGRWGYRVGEQGSEAMSCAGLMGLAIAAARPSLAERQTARARGIALAADPAFQSALRAVGQDARKASHESDIYYLWSLERVCVALGLRSLDGFDWYSHGASILVDRQDEDGGWPRDRWGRLPSTCLALLFLRKANLAFEIDRVLRLPAPNGETAVVPKKAQPSEGSKSAVEPDAAGPSASVADAGDNAGNDDLKVIVTGAGEQSFPRISVQFEVKRRDGTFLLDAARGDFRVTEEGRDVQVVDFTAPRTTEAIATTVVLVVDRSLSMEEEDRIGGLKRAVKSFLEKLPEGSKVALIAFGSDVNRLTSFTSNRGEIQTAVETLQPAGATRFYDAVAMALEMLNHETGQRRAVLALTDGEDTFSQSATLESVIGSAQALGLPVYTLGLGSEEEIESNDLRRLATSTRGQYYPARNADDLRAIYEQIAERIRSSYSLVYQSDRKLPDGTLRPVRIFYRASKAAGETAVFIPGMVVPAGGWSAFFLVLLAGLTVLLVLPARLARRKVAA